MPPATPVPGLSGAGVVLFHTEYRGEGDPRGAFATAGQRRRHYRHGGDLCRRDAAVPSLSGAANCRSLPDPQAAGAADPVLLAGYYAGSRALCVNPSLMAMPRTGSANAAAGTAAVVRHAC